MIQKVAVHFFLLPYLDFKFVVRQKLRNSIVDECFGDSYVWHFNFSDVHHLEKLRIVQLNIAKQWQVQSIVYIQITRRVADVRIFEISEAIFLPFGGAIRA